VAHCLLEPAAEDAAMNVADRTKLENWDVETVCCPLAAPDSYRDFEDDDVTDADPLLDLEHDPDPNGDAETVQLAPKDFREVAAAARAATRLVEARGAKSRMPEEVLYTKRIVVTPSALRAPIAPTRPRVSAPARERISAPPAPPMIAQPPPSVPAPPISTPPSVPPPPPAVMALPASTTPKSGLFSLRGLRGMNPRANDMPAAIKLPSVALRPIWIVTALVLLVACVKLIPHATSRMTKVTTQLETKR
jgi:hypothetical protein